MSYQIAAEAATRHTALRLPFPFAKMSSPPGPILLLRDFFRFAASVLPSSTVEFSFPDVLDEGIWPPMDWRCRRNAGIVASPEKAMAMDILRLSRRDSQIVSRKGNGFSRLSLSVLIK